MIRDLIKNLLLEYHDDYFSISYYGEIDDDNLHEAIYPSQDDIIKMGYTPQPISDEEESLVNNYKDIINSGNSDLAINKNKKRDGILGIFRTKNKVHEIKFNIKLTRHWFFRLHRTQDPKSREYPRIIDPNPFECINLINKNADKLARFVVLEDPAANVKYEIRGPSFLNFIVIFKNQDADGTKYEILFVSQIKGENFFDEKSDNKLPLR